MTPDPTVTVVSEAALTAMATRPLDHVPSTSEYQRMARELLRARFDLRRMELRFDDVTRTLEAASTAHEARSALADVGECETCDGARFIRRREFVSGDFRSFPCPSCTGKQPLPSTVALADVGEQLSARLLRIGEMDDGPDDLSYSFSLGVWHWQLPEDEAGSAYETLPAAVAALEARFPNGTGKQPRPAAEERPMQCSPITEPSTRYSEDWDGMVTRPAAHTARVPFEECDALLAGAEALGYINYANSSPRERKGMEHAATLRRLASTAERE